MEPLRNLDGGLRPTPNDQKLANQFLWRLTAVHNICKGGKERLEKALSVLRAKEAKDIQAVLRSHVIPQIEALMKQLAPAQALLNEEFHALPAGVQTKMRPSGVLQSIFRRSSVFQRLDEEVTHCLERAKEALETCDVLAQSAHYKKEFLGDLEALLRDLNDVALDCQNVAKLVKQ